MENNWILGIIKISKTIKMKKNILFVIGVVTILSAVSFLVGNFSRKNEKSFSTKTENYQETQQMKKLKIVAIKDIEDVEMLLDVAEKRGFLTKNGIELERIDVIGSATKTILAGDVDVYVGGLSGFLSAYLNGAETRWLGAPFSLFAQYGVSRYPENEYEKIKKVGVAGLGIEPHLATLIGLKNMGVDLKSVDFIISKENATKFAMLDEKLIDFAVVSPYRDLRETGYENKYNIVEPDNMLKGSGLLRGILTTKNILETKRDELSKFTLAIYQTLEYMSANPEDTKKYIQEKFGYDLERSSKVYESFVFSRGESEFIPKKENIGKLVELVNEYFKPEMLGRSLDEFVVPDLAVSAIEDVK